MGLGTDQRVLAVPHLGNSGWVSLRVSVAVEVGRSSDSDRHGRRRHLLSWAHLVARQIVGCFAPPPLASPQDIWGVRKKAGVVMRRLWG